MLELYFIFYRVPKMMTRLAREQNRSALAWSLLGIGAWIGAEVVVIFTLAFIYQIGVIAAGWREPEPAGLRFLTYFLGLAAALIAVTILSRVLNSERTEKALPAPPPPPTFTA
jgi:hypothetical protein